jgi:hypothetical protein
MGPGFATGNVSFYRATVAVVANASAPRTPSDVVAFLTNGTPDVAVIRPFRLDTTGDNAIVRQFAAGSGIAGFRATIGTTLFIGTPVQ